MTVMLLVFYSVPFHNRCITDYC